jgi:glycosyltransferase involved in cell wall biosynthesis
MNYTFSIITPEHDSKNIPFLLELYESILAQTYTNWEWVLYVNGNCTLGDIPEIIRNDPKVRIFLFAGKENRVGAIKNLAFFEGFGDILVEVDHDDLITPNCLEKLNEAYQNEEIGFVYSNNAVLHMQNKFIPFNSAHGWTYKMFDWKGQSLYTMNSFPPSSSSMRLIWYAPDHIRSWRKTVYQKIGGHNKELSICDDHELMIRTYLNTKMHHINEVLYIYRITGNNTWIERNTLIQQKTVELFHENAWNLAVQDAKNNNLLVVDLGGGINPRAGCLTIDNEDADVIANLNDGIPLESNSVGVLNASHIIEHLYDKQKIMSEIHRVLVHGGWAFIQVPSTDGRGAWQDPTHVSYWNENSFWYYTRESKAAYIRNKTIRFQEAKLNTFWWEHNVAITDAWLIALKNGPRIPGIVQI